MTKLFLLATLVAFSAVERAQAVPVLRQTSADFSGQLATIYPDHADPNLFYFLPNTGQVASAKDGKPLMGLTMSGINNSDPNDGMGLLTFVMEASLTPELRGELNAFKAKHPNARLTVVPFGKSYVSMLRSDGQPGDNRVWSKLIESLDIPPHAGVAETQVGVNMLLSEKGARFSQAMIKGSQPYNLALCFEVYGALPTMHAEVTMNYKQIYNYFQTSASFGYLWWGVSITSVTELLIRDGHIKIKILGGDAKFEDYVKSISAELAKTYLVPVLQAGPVPTGYELLRSTIQLGFNNVYKEERSIATFTYDKQEFITDERCVNLPMANVREYADQIIQLVD